ncbi:HEAT repeat domain-containing protein, partial [Mycolicibacterium alvei]
AATTDGNREVRIAAVGGLATLRAGADAVRVALDDPDPLVRATALAALGAVGCTDGDVVSVEKAFTESAWQIRQGAARALAGARSELAVPTLSRALEDQHLDVRKAAVLSLSRWAGSESTARRALTAALDDSDADVRAYARQALTG